MPQEQMAYIGFWIRLVAFVVDSILLTMVLIALFAALVSSGVLSPEDLLAAGGAEAELAPRAGGWGQLIQFVVSTVLVLVFWRFKSATPGKMIFSAVIADAESGGRPSSGQLVGRYFAYIVSTLPLLLGFFWIAVDRRKQGWHDKLAGTVVIRRRTA